jgi:hypothetical protein
MENRRQRTLTDDDVQAIRDAINRDHICLFDEETRQIMRTITMMYRDGRNVILKAFIGAVFVGALYLAALSFGFGKGSE